MFTPRALVLLFACLVMGVAQTAVSETPEEAALKKYLASRGEKSPVLPEEARDFRTPPIYTQPVADTTAAAVRQGHPDGELRLFGYDMFGAPSSEFFVPSEAPVPESYVLGPGDGVIVNLWGRVEKTYDLTVDREGKVFVPTAGEVTLWGLTVPQAEKKLREVLGRIYTDFELGLVLGKIKSIKVYVFGAVKKPGAYTVSGLSTLFNVLYLSGGPDQHGSLRNIKLSRDGKEIHSIDLYDVLLRGQNVDVRLANNDVIFVPVASRTAAIRGCVRVPAIYELLGHETVRDVINLAGGASPDAYLESITIKRVEDNARHVVLNVNLSGSDTSQDSAVANGDTIEVSAVYDLTERYVELRGWVKYSGKYAFTEGARVSDLLDGQVRIDSYLGRANVLRTNADMSRRLIAVDLNAVLARDSTADIPLQERDVLTVYSIHDIERVRYVSIEGEVLRESTYELTSGMRLSDVIFLAGGLRKSAYVLYAEVARVDPGGHSDIMHADLKDCLNSPGGPSDLELVEDDKIFVREIPEWTLHDLVEVSGEVRFPGRYALRTRRETLSQLAERAGGFTDEAFLKGAVFERGSIEEDIRRRNLIGIIENLQEVSLDSTTVASQKEQIRSLESTSMKRIVVDLEGLFVRGEKANDIELRDGDRIYIPPMPSGVHVMGAVASSGTIKYVPRKNFRFYLLHAGGLVKSADKDEIRIVKPDGRVYNGGLSGVDIEIGDSIVVPKKVVTTRDWWKIVSSSLVIVSSAVTTAYLITNL